MTRTVIPRGFRRQAAYAEPALSLQNDAGHSLNVHVVSSSIVRVVHELPRQQYPQKTNDGVHWESNAYKPRMERENYLPVDENEYTPSLAPFIHPERNEFVYGLGESRGGIEKTGKKFTMEGRDALSYDFDHGDPLYKVTPFYAVFNRKLNRWYGVYYNTLADSYFDMGSEGDVLFGCFRSYKANAGPLDYYVMLGDGTLPSILTEYASLMSPKPLQAVPHPVTTSSSLPPLSQFGYLASSLSLAAETKAQESIIEFVKRSRKEGFAIDGLYLSSGWCQNEKTDNRHYFAWNRSRYPDPAALGRAIEADLEVQTIVNIKPWLLTDHPSYASALELHKRTPGGIFVKCADDRTDEMPDGAQVDLVWTSGFAAHGPGSYFDYSSNGGTEWWRQAIKQQLLENGLTGMWIDNNEMAGMVDDDAKFAGQLSMYEAVVPVKIGTNVEERAGWGLGEIRLGAVGKAIQTMGMARATYEAVVSERPSDRPVIVSRSGVPGIQAYAHATWSGDNSTSWKALKYGTKMTLSVGMSFGPGLYGHDIGGFAGKHHPSPELLIRWCQNGMMHTRFTVHSWKEVSTTMWMYGDDVTEILRKTLDLRYRLAPTFYSLYLTHYYRRGWPVLKPLLWHHSTDPFTLKMDEEFIFGSHVLVAPVTERGATSRRVYLPETATDGERSLLWCDFATGEWYAGREGQFHELGKSFINKGVKGIQLTYAPLEKIPMLVRAGGALMLGGPCTRNIYDGINERTLIVFPAPFKHPSGQTGTFTLIEDDFRSNNHTGKGAYTEVQFWFKVVDEDTVGVGYDVVKKDWPLSYKDVAVRLPPGDARRIVAGDGFEVNQDMQGEYRLCVKL
ncbi:hypothetical protein OIV83_003780 [Microbotryomycetes sp. JL201]|nr:hypothetical protein OIV83_003780 [Microbotryomycetes sp. JL201]